MSLEVVWSSTDAKTFPLRVLESFSKRLRGRVAAAWSPVDETPPHARGLENGSHKGYTASELTGCLLL